MRIYPLVFLTLWQSLSFAGSVEIDGRNLTCKNARIRFSPRIEGPGMASDNGNLILNFYGRESRHSAKLKWFIFFHECGHIQGVHNEAKADAYAAAVAVREGWYDAALEKEICHSWGPMDAPADDEGHPAPRVRCRLLQQQVAALQLKLGTQLAAASPFAPPVEQTVEQPRAQQATRQPAGRAPAAARREPPPIVAYTGGNSSSGFLIDEGDVGVVR